MTGKGNGQCSDERMQAILAAAGADSQRGVDAIDRALAEFPGDARLYFLKGSLQIGLKRFIEAHEALSQAIAIAPAFDLARFQLGFFELTSGEPANALATWEPLRALPQGHWMLSFVTGLEHLIADRFEPCIAALREGIATNLENLPLNHDMELIIGQCEKLIAARPEAEVEGDAAEVSATSLLLGTRRH